MTREEAIQRLYRMGRSHVGIIDENTLADNKALSMAIEALSEPKTGRWKLVDHLWQCDQCQYRQNEMSPTNFCPSCGAKMRGDYK